MCSLYHQTVCTMLMEWNSFSQVIPSFMELDMSFLCSKNQSRDRILS